MLASGEQGCPVAGWAQTRTVAPASGTPRELKTMSSLRVPCACTGATAPGTRCSASISHAQKIPIAFFDRIIGFFDPFRRDMRFQENFADLSRESVFLWLFEIRLPACNPCQPRQCNNNKQRKDREQ